MKEHNAKRKRKSQTWKKTKTREWISQTNNDQKHNRHSCLEALKMNLELFILSTKQSIQNSKVAYTMCKGGNIERQASMATFSCTFLVQTSQGPQDSLIQKNETKTQPKKNKRNSLRLFHISNLHLPQHLITKTSALGKPPPTLSLLVHKTRLQPKSYKSSSTKCKLTST